MKRNSTLSLRKPEITNLARGLGFNKARVDKCFGNFKSVLEKYKFIPDQIFNLDETGITTVLSSPKVVAPKGKKQIGLVASAERGELVTYVEIIGATGNALSPVYIFPRVRNIEDYLEDGPALSSAFEKKSGWMTGELFVKTLEHIVKHTRCNNENKILLPIDNHKSHTTLAAIPFARENRIVLLSFPPHTSHKLQPLDVEVFGPFKGKCAVSLNDWMSSNPGRTITVKHVPKLTKKPFLEAFSPRNITSSFEKPGIWPLNSLAFNDEDFDATLVYHKQSTAKPANAQVIRKMIIRWRNEDESEMLDLNNNEETNVVSKSSTMLSPESVRPLPKVKKQKKALRRPKANQGKSRVYTSTPEKRRLEEIEEEKMAKQKKKAEKQKEKLKKPSQVNVSPSEWFNKNEKN
ncbi:hypothetical protein ILUMI_27262 [Ignelater luminosus]|uniref:DDE-1 domain-containing protein n=1 Tax=Ignelater luminosus TaxID=2038154 RepID=A0A8K0C6V7_IGNLU|nr:hypothetical protein ILUMI_27262 [Ignelater luminosus]